MRFMVAAVVFAFGCGPGSVDDGMSDGDGDETDDADGMPAPDAAVDAMPRVVDITGPDVLPHVQEFANAMCTATGACEVGTRNGHSPTADRAIDILVSDVYGEVPSDNNALGDAVAQFTLDHFGEHAVMYVIWMQRYNDSSGWDPMEDRGSITANHYDHVHVSFEADPPP